MIMVLALHGVKRRHGDVRHKSSGILQLAETRLNLIMILVVVRMFLLNLTGWYRMYL
jgi:hypothetical protein